METGASMGALMATTGGLPVLSCKYDSFGNILEQNGDFELPFRFAGGIWDEDTKLIRFGVRDYDPETGRWTSVEPLGFSGSRNWYVYARNNGVNYLDLDGRIWNPFREYGYWLGGQIYDGTQYLKNKFRSNFRKLKNLFNELKDFSKDLVCPKKDDAPCEGRITPEDILNESLEVNSNGHHREFRKWGGKIIAFWDFYRVTTRFPLRNKDTEKACDGTYVNYHIGQKGNNFPTLWFMKGSKNYNHKIRYPIIRLP